MRKFGEVAGKPFSTNSSLVIWPSPSTSTAFLERRLSSSSSGSVKRSDFLFQFLLMESNCINARKWDFTWSPESSRPSDPGRPAARRAGRARSPSPCDLIQLLMFEWREGLMGIKKSLHIVCLWLLFQVIYLSSAFSHLFLFTPWCQLGLLEFINVNGATTVRVKSSEDPAQLIDTE